MSPMTSRHAPLQHTPLARRVLQSAGLGTVLVLLLLATSLSPHSAGAWPDDLELAWAAPSVEWNRALAWGDYDGDGDLDLAVANNSIPTVQPVHVYRNDGGTLTMAWSSFLPDYATSVAWGDMDNDGDLDLAVGNDDTGGGQPVRVYRYENGTFALHWSSPGSYNTLEVAWVDIDKDGDDDLSMVDSNDLIIFRSDPPGTLTEFYNDPGGSWSYAAIAWGDYNADTYPDLWIATNNLPLNVAIYTNNSGTGFSYSSSIGDGSVRNITDLALGDYDGDGDLDVATGVSHGANVVWRNNAGSWQKVWTAPSYEVWSTSSVDWGDWDGDGDLDLAVGNDEWQHSMVYRNVGNRWVLGWTAPEAEGSTGIAFGDWDGDADLDLAVANRGRTRIYANGGGMVEPYWASDEQDTTMDAAWGDYDGDGDPDLVVANLNQPVRLYRNDHGQDLVVVWSSAETADSRSVAWGDYDGDGDLDLAVGNNNAPSRVYRNDAGALTLAWSTAGEPTRSMAWGDYDGDGWLDLAVANDGAPSRVYHNDGGALSLAWSTPGSAATESVAWGDYDGDGRLDLALGNYYAPSEIYHNDGGSFTLGLTLPASAVQDLEWGDWDGDGDLDLAIGDLYDSRILENDGGTLTTVWQDAGWQWTFDLAWGDYDGDGDLDLAVGNDTRASVIYRNNSRENAGVSDANRLALAWSAPEASYNATVAWGDMDSDGDLDLAVASSAGGNQVYRNTTANLALAWSSSDVAAWTDAAWADFDGDGDLDLAVASWNQTTKVYRNDGGQLTVLWSFFSPDTTATIDLAWGDWEGDADQDLLMLIWGRPNLFKYDHASGTLGGPVWSDNSSTAGSCAAWGDYDGDGDLDLAVGGASGQALRLYRNWTAEKSTIDAQRLTHVWSAPSARTTVEVAWSDMDGDGDLDLAVGNTNQPSQVYRNERGSLVLYWETPLSEDTQSIAWGDYDGDGDPDLALGNDAQPNRIYRNDGSTFALAWSSPETDATTSIAWQDYDGDGDVDLAVGNFQLGTLFQPLRIYRNDGGSLALDWSSHEDRPAEAIAWADDDGDGDADLLTMNSEQSISLYRSRAANGASLVGATTARIVHPAGHVAQFYSTGSILSGPTIPINYTLYDPEGDAARFVRAYYSYDGGSTWSPAVAASGTITTNLEASPAGTAHLYSWDVRNSSFFGSSDNVVFRLDVYQGFGHAGPYVYPFRSARTEPFRARGNQVRVMYGSAPAADAVVQRLPAGEAGTYSWYQDDTGVPFRTTSSGYLLGRGEVRTGDRLVALMPADLPIAYWKFDEGTGSTARDVTGHEHDATLYRYSWGYSGWSTDTPALQFANPYSLYTAYYDSSNLGYAYVADHPHLEPGREMTLAGWVWSTDPWRSQMLVGKWRLGSPAYGYRMYVSGSQFNPVIVDSAGGSYSLWGGSVPQMGWTHLAVTWKSGGKMVAYVNGVAVAERAASNNPIGTSTTNLVIGYMVDGYVDDVRLYGRAFSPSEVAKLAQGVELPALPFDLYYTSAAPVLTGVDPFTVTAGGVQTLTVQVDNPLMLIPLDISLQWDARNDTQFLQQLEFDLQRASALLYDWTDGQAALGDVHIYHDRVHWDDADVRIYATNRMRPNAAQGGIVESIVSDPQHANITYAPGMVHIGAVWNRYGDPGGSLDEDWPRTLAHELGHYALYLDDNYLGFDAAGRLIPVAGCTGAMSDPYREDYPYDELHRQATWLPECAETLSQRVFGRADWATLEAVYPWLSGSGDNRGPTNLPLAGTDLTWVEPITAPTTLEDPTFYLLDEGYGMVLPGSSARGLLLHGDLLTDLGSPTLDRIVARGARLGDRLCVLEPEAARLGCETIVEGDTQLVLHEVPTWQPEILLTPLDTSSMAIAVTNVPAGLSLEARLYPFSGSGLASIPLAWDGSAYGGVVTSAVPIPAGYVHVWVNEAEPRREALTDYVLGSNPGRIYGNLGAPARGRSSPAVSADGQAILFGNLEFADGEFFALQSLVRVPTPLPWATPVGHAYRLLASSGAPDLTAASLSIAYMANEVVPGEERWIRMYFWDGAAWAILPTTLDTTENMAAAPCQGEGIYVLMSSIEVSLRPGWNLLAYPIAETRPVTETLLSIQGAYTLVYGYDATQPLDLWDVYGPGAPAWVNDLDAMAFGRGYWISATEAITLYLKGAGNEGVQVGVPNPPATFYGRVLGSGYFTPLPGMAVTAWVDGHPCGQGTTLNVGGQVSYVIGVSSDDEAAGCGAPGRTVTFRVAGQTMRAAPEWNNGRLWPLDLRPNRAPAAVDDSATTPEDTAVLVPVLNNDSDIDGDPYALVLVGAPAHGSTAISGTAVLYTPALNYHGPDSFLYTIGDGFLTATASVAVNITAVNDGPVAGADSASTLEDVAVAIPVLANDSDVDGDPLTILGVTTPAHGVAAIRGDAVVYTPTLNFYGSDGFSYTIGDGLLTATAAVAVSIGPVNDAPVARDDAATTPEDTAVAIAVLANDSDVEGAPLAIVALGVPAHGTAEISGSAVLYTPAPGYYGSDGFAYTISDGLLTDSASVALTVTVVNAAPILLPDSATTPEDTAIVLDVLANDSDPDDDPLTILAVSTPAHGTAAISGTAVLYTPEPNYYGPDAFAYTAGDGLVTGTAPVAIAVTSVNDAPAAVPDAATTAEDHAVAIDVLANDSDVEGDRLALVAVEPPAHGTAVIDSGLVIYTPTLNYYGLDSLVYTISDSRLTATASVAITVTAVNDPPVAAADMATTTEDVALPIAVLDNDLDVDGDALTLAAVGTPAHGTAEINGSLVLYTPAPDYYGPDSFLYTIDDGLLTATAAVTVSVTAVNDPPAAAPDTATTPEDTAVAVDVLANDTDPEGDPLSIVVVSAPAHGTAAISGTAAVYTPGPDYNGHDSFLYVVSDGRGRIDYATVALTITAVNDPPTLTAFADVTTTIGTPFGPVAFAVSDVDSPVEELTVAGYSDNPGLVPDGSIFLGGSGAARTLTITPTAGLAGTARITITVSDGQAEGSAQFTLTVSGRRVYRFYLALIGRGDR